MTPEPKAKTTSMWIYKQIWNFSEWSGIGLGRFAPYVFGRMIGCKSFEIDDLGKKL